MDKADIAALLALAAAFFIAIGNVIHQRSACEMAEKPLGHLAEKPVGHLTLFLRLLRDRQWWLGSAVAAAGFCLQAAALGLGSVLLVQAVLVTSLLFALPISAHQSHRRVTRWQWMWAVLLAGAVVIIVTVGNPTAGQSRGTLQAWLAVAAVLGPVLALCLMGAQIFAGPTSAVLLAVVSGALWGLFAILTKAVVGRLDVTSWTGVVELLRTPELYVWAVVAIAGTAMQQASFGAGALTASLPAMTITEPMVACVLGVVVLGETLRPGEAGWFTLVVAVVVVVAAIAALARGQAATRTAA